MAIVITTPDDGLSFTFNDIALGEAMPAIPGNLRRVALDAGVVVQTTEDLTNTKNQYRRIGYDEAYAEVKAALKEHYRYDTYALKQVGEALGISLSTKFRVTLELDGADVLSVIVEADDEDDAMEMVRSNIEQQEYTVEVEFDYSGEGEVEDSTPYEYEFGDLMDALPYNFRVEEYED